MLELCPWHEAGAADGGMVRGGRVEARQWLERQLMDDADAALARGYALGLADGTDLSRLDRAQVNDQLSAALLEGRLHSDLGTPVVLRPLTQTAWPAAAAPPPPARAGSSPRATSAPGPAAETTFGPDMDVAAQVAVLVQAAKDGMPFCEECAKAAAKRALDGSAA